MPPFQKSAVFLNIVQKAFDPPPLLFEHLSYFAGGFPNTYIWGIAGEIWGWNRYISTTIFNAQKRVLKNTLCKIGQMFK